MDVAEGTRSNTPIFVHIRTSWDVCALLCNSGAKSWRMRRDGLEPVQPRYPKIAQPYSRGSMCQVDALFKIPLLKSWAKEDGLFGIRPSKWSPGGAETLAPTHPARGCMDKRVIVWGSLWRLPWGSSIQHGSWNIRSRITRFWSSSLASQCWLCHSYGSGPPGRTAGSLKNRLTEWF